MRACAPSPTRAVAPETRADPWAGLGPTDQQQHHHSGIMIISEQTSHEGPIGQERVGGIEFKGTQATAVAANPPPLLRACICPARSIDRLPSKESLAAGLTRYGVALPPAPPSERPAPWLSFPGWP